MPSPAKKQSTPKKTDTGGAKHGEDTVQMMLWKGDRNGPMARRPPLASPIAPGNWPTS